MRPAKVTGFECPFNARMARMGARAGHTAIEMVTFEDGSIFKSIHGVGPSKNSIWYTVYGSEGRMESAREDAGADGVSRVYENIGDADIVSYTAEMDETAKRYGHSGSDYYCLHGAIDRIMGDESAEYVDVYEALDMWMCGHFGYLSVLDGGVPKGDSGPQKEIRARQIPRRQTLYRPEVAGDQAIPSYSKGELDIPDEIYDVRRREWNREHGVLDYGKKKGE